MTQEQWLTQYIASAFADVTLANGVDIHAAQSSANYADADEDSLSVSAERNDWRLVSPDDLFPRSAAVLFLDPTGFRFYTPAIMTSIINAADNADDGGLISAFFAELYVTSAGLIKGIPFDSLFSTWHRAAIVRFLKYLVYNCGSGPESVAARRLKELQTRTIGI